MKLLELKSLASECDTFKDENLEKFLEFEKNFTKYSERNRALLFLQRSDATDVRGFVAWKQAGRKVRKGERGLGIIAPHIIKDDDGDPVMHGASVAHVWDISQTEPA